MVRGFLRRGVAVRRLFPIALPVIPAKAGISVYCTALITQLNRDSRFRGNDIVDFAKADLRVPDQPRKSPPRGERSGLEEWLIRRGALKRPLYRSPDQPPYGTQELRRT
jgi:hypothetical protein